LIMPLLRHFASSPPYCKTPATIATIASESWQEDLPAQPHKLVVAVARHDRFDHGKKEKHEQALEHEPDHARNPGKGRHRGNAAASRPGTGWSPWRTW
jgi:hypothetical protein